MILTSYSSRKGRNIKSKGKGRHSQVSGRPSKSLLLSQKTEKEVTRSTTCNEPKGITLNRRTGSSTSCATGASASLHDAGITLNRRTGSSTSCATGASASLHDADVPRAIYNISRPHRTPKNYYVFALFYAVLGIRRTNLYLRIYTRVYACIYTSSCKSRWCTGPKSWG